jgi:hypothetical protein
MRNFIDLIEAREIPGTQFSEGCPVYRVATRSKLELLIARYGSLRAEMFDTEMDVWEAGKATHRAYEDYYGEGMRLMIGPKSIEVNIYDFAEPEDEGHREEFAAIPFVQKMFPDFAEWSFVENEV